MCELNTSVMNSKAMVKSFKSEVRQLKAISLIVSSVAKSLSKEEVVIALVVSAVVRIAKIC